LSSGRYLTDSRRGSCGNAPVGFTLWIRKLIEREEATRVTDAGGSGGAGPVGAGRESGAGGIRNVVLVGHSGSGKTTLAEALLLYTGSVGRAGRVEDGTTVSDFDEVEIRQKRSVNLALTPFVSDGITVNMLDTPGYADFTGDLRAGLRAADCALFVVAATDGVDGVTRLLWDECAAVGMPRAVVITKIDHNRADYATVLAECQDAFGEGVLPLYLPVPGAGDTGVSGLIGLLSETLYDYSSGARAASPVSAESDIEQMAPARPPPGLAHRGDHHRERRRDAHGAVPVR
jgi:elongation factor G